MSNKMNAKNKTPWQLNVVSVLALAGAVVSAFQSKHYYGLRAGTEGFRSYCNLGEGMNCDAVALSSYADLFQGWPLSSFAAGWFLVLLLVSLIARNASWRRESLRVAFGVSCVALAASAFYLFIMVSVIKSYCLLCLIIDAISLSSFAMMLTLRREIFGEIKPDWGKWRTLAGTGAAALAIAVIALKGLEARTMDSGTLKILVDQVITSSPMPVGAGPEFASMGPADAPVTIVEFADFQCPSCRLGALTLKALMNRYPDKVRVVFRNFPMHPACNSLARGSSHSAACEAAKAAVCGHRQGKFELVYEELFENQAALAPGRVSGMVQKAVGTSADLGQCMELPETGQAVIADTEEGIRLNVRATPTFFINGHKVEGAYPLTAWVQLVEHFLRQP